MREDMRGDHRYLRRMVLGIEVSGIGREKFRGLFLGRTPLAVQGHMACLEVEEDIEHNCWILLFLAECFFFLFFPHLVSLGMIQKMAWSVHGRSVLMLFASMNRLVS